jgi:hypothetical protein
MIVRDRSGVDRRSANFRSAFISDPNATAAIEQFGPAEGQVARQIVSSRSRGVGALEQHAAGIEQNLALEQEVKKETRHAGHVDA